MANRFEIQRPGVTFTPGSRLRFDRLLEALRSPAPIFDEIGARLVTRTQIRFEQGIAPSGERWPVSARAERQGGQTLVDSARLKNSIEHRADNSGVEVGTNVIYAAAHQFGAKTRPRTIRPRLKEALFFPGAAHPVKKVEHPGSNIPARPFLGLAPTDPDWIHRLIAERLAA